MLTLIKCQKTKKMLIQEDPVKKNFKIKTINSANEVSKDSLILPWSKENFELVKQLKRKEYQLKDFWKKLNGLGFKLNLLFKETFELKPGQFLEVLRGNKKINLRSKKFFVKEKLMIFTPLEEVGKKVRKLCKKLEEKILKSFSSLDYLCLVISKPQLFLRQDCEKIILALSITLVLIKLKQNEKVSKLLIDNGIIFRIEKEVL